MKRLLTITFAVITALLWVSCAKEPTKRFTLDDDTKDYIWVSPIPIEDERAEWPWFWADEWGVENAPHVLTPGILGYNVEGHYCTLSFTAGMATKTDYRYLGGRDGKDFDGTEIDILQPAKVLKKPYSIPYPEFTIEGVGSGYMQGGLHTIMVFEGVTYHKVTLKEFKEMQKKVDTDFKARMGWWKIG